MAMAVAVGVEGVNKYRQVGVFGTQHRTAEQNNVFFGENNKLRVYIQYRSP